MKKILTSALTVVVATVASAQCSPNQLYADSVYGVWPDTIQGFSAGTVNAFYSDTLNLLVPSDAGLIDPQYNGFTLDSVVLTGITGLPPGLSVICNSQTAAACTFLPNQVGCGLIEGTPTAAGVYPITLDVTAYTTFFVVIPVPQTFSGYSISIGPDGTGVVTQDGLEPGKVRNTPNPFSERTNIEFNLAKAGQARLKVYNLVGEELFSRTLAGKQGVNSLVFEAAGLQSGAYLYKVEAAGRSTTGRMLVAR
jgi:Secretion system C-terminal sorting domain